ncbi:cupin domain-containing protein [Nocardioides coralli]|uniref:cupin domain-containing protein n=1 Tax=Nocardioides coralli TaxID=2872154 RepID=UPI001CA3AEB5|nr:cupin domain-containing protein [Nocardioides coralli]QZY28905.1 cupin domain-containing protein [Nocardioides coralli]
MALNALDLLSGDAQTFVAKVWATRVHIHHTEPERLVGMLSLDDVDHLLTETAIRTPSVRLAKDGSVLPESGYTRRGASLAGKALTGLVDARRLLEQVEDGATAVLQGLHRYWPPLRDLVAELELELGHPCQANAYLTPPGAQGFAVHSDSHDVFVFQTHGDKRWEVHTEDRVDDVLLEPGVSMYLPTGTPHAARSQESMSLHVTLGINQLTWRTLVERSLAGVLARVPDSHLPAGYLDDPDALVAGLREQLTAVADDVRRLDPEVAGMAHVERFLSHRGTRLAGGLRDLASLDRLDDTTRLVRRVGHPCVLVDTADGLRVLLGDRTLDVPGYLRPALEQVRAAEELSPGDLAGHLDPESRLVLCRRLVREGLLRVVG